MDEVEELMSDRNGRRETVHPQQGLVLSRISLSEEEDHVFSHGGSFLAEVEYFA